MKQPPEKMTDEELLHFCEAHIALSARCGFFGKTIRRLVELAGIEPPSWLHDGDLFMISPSKRWVIQHLVSRAR